MAKARGLGQQKKKKRKKMERLDPYYLLLYSKIASTPIMLRMRGPYPSYFIEFYERHRECERTLGNLGSEANI